MDKKSFIIGVLSIMATVLLAAVLIQPQPVQAEGGFAVKDMRYQMIATRSSLGGESIYIVDNSTGLVANLSWNNNQLRPTVIRPLTDLFK